MLAIPQEYAGVLLVTMARNGSTKSMAGTERVRDLEAALRRLQHVGSANLQGELAARDLQIHHAITAGYFCRNARKAEANIKFRNEAVR
jgi:hypothetical protein